MRRFKFKNHVSLSLFTLIFIAGCSSGGNDDLSGTTNENGNTQNLPTDFVLTVDVLGQNEDPENLNGNGSGEFSVSATASNAEYYRFEFDGNEFQNTTGNLTYKLTAPGNNQFTLSVHAYSSTNERISKFKTLNIFVSQDTNGGTGNNDTLVWSDEFDGNGTINTNNWTYEIGGGGWGNQEVQTYTDNPDNVIIENGILKINTIKEPNGSYTSARIITKNKLEFTYGRIEISAKLPSAAGTWPALWMLGANIDYVSWPKCGEIDIMEQFINKNSVSSTLHWFNPDNVNSLNPEGQASNGRDIANSTSDEFHVYSLNWTSSSFSFSLDGVDFFTTGNSGSLPFNQNFFLIFNVAMGGTNGGTIDPNFTTDTMEVDYIRVYQ